MTRTRYRLRRVLVVSLGLVLAGTAFFLLGAVLTAPPVEHRAADGDKSRPRPHDSPMKPALGVEPTMGPTQPRILNPDDQSSPTATPVEPTSPTASGPTDSSTSFDVSQPPVSQTTRVTVSLPPALPGPPMTEPGVSTSPLILSAADDGTHLSVKLGDIILVRLPYKNGFTWLVGENDPTQIDGGNVTPAPEPVGYIDVSFQAVGTGTSTLSLADMDDDSFAIDATVTFTVSVS